MAKPDIWIVEGVFAAWIGVSLFLLSASLLFYHITKLNSIEMNPVVASVFAVILILVSFVYNVASIVPYFQRVTAENDVDTNEIEQQYKWVYTAIGVLLGIVQLGIAITIILGTKTS